MLCVGQERTFRVGGVFPPGFFNPQKQRKVSDHKPKEELLLRHGSLLIFDGGHTVHSMYPAADDAQFNPNGFEWRFSILFRYTTEAMRKYGPGSKCNTNGGPEQYEAAVKRFQSDVASGLLRQGNLWESAVTPSAPSTTGPLSLNEPVGQAAVMNTSIVLSEPSPQLAMLDRARQMLAESRTLSEVKKIRDIAEAARTYAKAAHLGRESQNYAAEIALEASRRAGEILKQLERKPGERTDKPAASVAGGSEYARTLLDTQTPERTAQHWQTLADIPEETFTDYIQQSKDLKTEITQAGLLKVAQRAASRERPTPAVATDRTPIAALEEALNVINNLTGPMSLIDTVWVYANIAEELKSRVIEFGKMLREQGSVSS
jgi:hypothetical protein